MVEGFVHFCTQVIDQRVYAMQHFRQKTSPTNKKAMIVFCSLIYAMHFLFQVLHLSHNKLKKLPDSIGDLKMLQTLDVSHNSLKELPETLSKVCSP